MSSIKGVPAMDVLPEHFPYHDDGCELSSSCLRCALHQCKYDDPGWLQRERRAHRDNQVLQVRRREGATVVELARRFAISQRTVHRILARDQGCAEPSTASDWQSFSRQPARQMS